MRSEKQLKTAVEKKFKSKLKRSLNLSWKEVRVLKETEKYSQEMKTAKGAFKLHFQVVEMDWRLCPEGTPQRSEKWREFSWI